MSTALIPFNKPYVASQTLDYVRQALESTHQSGHGPFTQKVHQWLEEAFQCPKVLLTHSCTAALEMAALLLDIQNGDEVIVPSFTFVSTANAFALRGASLVFVDCDPDFFCLSLESVRQSITVRTKAIVAVHYAGNSCDMEALMALASSHGITVIEDAAQSFGSSFRGKPLGTFGALATLSFHETKNIQSGEGGALLINTPSLAERAEILWEKGTNRSRFFRGQVDKYTWVDLGSSYLPAESVAAHLFSQLEESDSITRKRLALWDWYHSLLAPYEAEGWLKRPVTPDWQTPNAHLYPVLFPDPQKQQDFIHLMKQAGIQCVFHYLPLHQSPAGTRFGTTPTPCTVTEEIAFRLVRLPMHLFIGLAEQQAITEALQWVLPRLYQKTFIHKAPQAVPTENNSQSPTHSEVSAIQQQLQQSFQG